MARPVAVAAAATGRVARRPTVLATVALGSVPVTVALAREAPDLAAPFIVLGLVTGASIGWATHDPAPDLLGATPLAPWRLPARVLWALGVAAANAVVFALAAATLRDPGVERVAARLAEAAAAGAVALAAGSAAARHEDDAGVTGVVAGLVVPLTVAGLSVRWPVLPGFGPGPAHDRWWVLAAMALVVVVLCARTPRPTARRGPGRARC